MDERFKFVLFAIAGLTIFWFIIVLFCLPQDDFLEKWPQIDNQIQKSAQKIDKIRRDSPHQTRIYSHQDSAEFLNYFQTNAIPDRLSLTETLFYQLMPIDFTSPTFNDHNTSVLSKSEHESDTRRLKVVKNRLDRYVKTEGDRLFAFNLLVSNRIGSIRDLPDSRNPRCLNQSGVQPANSSKIRLKASIIICYFNEAPSALIRTIASVLKRSPLDRINEIIIIDDSSQQEYHMDVMRPYIRHDLVKFLRTSKREGLIRARLFGSEHATGDVLIFLDSHVEANVGWFEPLLQAIQADNKTIACPIIDIINSETLIYSASPMVRGGMNWALNFKWDSVPSEKLKTYADFVKPIESPTMAGGLYAINRDYFYQLGAYDPGMELWGGENIEMSLRTWMCGGRIHILPCSRLGHIFRKTRPYGPEPNKPDSLLFNSHRSARVWLDEYLELFYENNPDARNLDSGDISDRLKLKEQLSCRNFTWFLDNVYPDLKKHLKPVRDTEQEVVTNKPYLFSPNPRRTKGINESIRRHQRMVKEFDGHNHVASNNLRQINHKPAILSRFQIQSYHNNLCIESKRGLMTRSFSRLVLNACIEPNQNMLANITHDLSKQLWTETDDHTFQFGEDQCLDLVKNLPLLRRCHRLSSFQDWTYFNKTQSTHIYNSGGHLCLGVEKVQPGEPLIVTLCDINLEDDIYRNVPLHRETMDTKPPLRKEHMKPGWRTGPAAWSKQTGHVFGMKPPSQLWHIRRVQTQTSNN